MSDVFVYTGNGQSIPTDVVSVRSHSNVVKVEDHAFKHCEQLKTVELNNGLKKIGCRAFRGCTLLDNITLPSSIIEIGGWAFSYCTNLRGVALNEGLNKIEQSAFEGCSSLQSITIPSMVTEINEFAFCSCNNLREVAIHNEKVQIGDKVFCKCTSLERFSFPGLLTRLNNVIQAGQRDIEAKMNGIPAVEWRGGELSVPAISRQERRIWGMQTLVEIDIEKLNKIGRLITYYEIKEATTLFELALWKSKIDLADISNPADRGACRMEVPGPVKDSILKYL